MKRPIEQSEFISGMDRLGHKIVGGLARIFGALSGKGEEPYQYGIVSGDGNGFVTIGGAVGDVETATIQISQEADFIASRLVYIGVTAAGVIMPPQTATGPSVTCLITDGATDRQLSNVQLHLDTMGGTGSRSVPWVKNRLFRRNSTINFAFTNRQAVATTLWLTLWGYKIYDQNALDLVRRR